jgi:hypothetical protein
MQLESACQAEQQGLDSELPEQANSLFRETERARQQWRVHAGLITAERLEQQINEHLAIINRLSEERAARHECYFGERNRR